MSRGFIFGADVRVDVRSLNKAQAERFGLAIGRTIAADVLRGSVVTVACPSPDMAKMIADAALRPVREALPHTVIKQAPEVISEASIEAVHAKASARHRQALDAIVVSTAAPPAQPPAPAPLRLRRPDTQEVEFF